MNDLNQQLLMLVRQMANNNSVDKSFQDQTQMAVELAAKVDRIAPDTREELQNFSTVPSETTIRDNPLQVFDFIKFSLTSPDNDNTLQNAFLLTNSIENNLRAYKSNLPKIYESLGEIYSIFSTLQTNQDFLDKSSYYNSLAYENGRTTPFTVLGYLNQHLDSFIKMRNYEFERYPIYMDLAKLALEDSSGLFSYFLGTIIKGDIDDVGYGRGDERADSVRWFKLSHNCGFLESSCELAQYYIEERVLEEDRRMGINMLEQAADKGYSEAKFLLGLCYLDGIVVKKDQKKATSLIKEAADLGHIEAQYRLNQLI